MTKDTEKKKDGSIRKSIRIETGRILQGRIPMCALLSEKLDSPSCLSVEESDDVERLYVPIYSV